MRKVEPLARALEGKQAWMTGLRRVEAPTRANAPIVASRRRSRHREGQPARDRGPTTTSRPTSSDHELLEHPLAAQGYPSIGCWPCTRPVADGDDPRAGRWAGQGKIECGLHGWPEA